MRVYDRAVVIVPAVRRTTINNVCEGFRLKPVDSAEEIRRLLGTVLLLALLSSDQ